jgi:hypothetical protein
LDALEAVIKAAPQAERDELTAVLDAYGKDFPDEIIWAASAQWCRPECGWNSDRAISEALKLADQAARSIG